MAEDLKKRILRNLKALECPFLSGYSDGVMLDIVLTPGEQRLRVLQWILTTFHPILCEMFEQPHNIEGLVTKLGTAMSWLCLCQPEEHEIIQGTTDFQKQLNFIDALLNIATVNLNLQDETEVENKLFHQSERSCLYIDALCQREDMRELLPATANLFPPDIRRACKIHSKSSMSLSAAPKSPKVTSASLTSLAQTAEELGQEIEKRKKELSKQTQKLPPKSIDLEALQLHQKSLSVNLSTLEQLLRSFHHTYEEDWKPWTNKEQHAFSALGPACKQIHSYVEHITKSLEALNDVKQAFKDINSVQPFKKDTIWKGDPTMGDLLSSLDTLLKEY